MYPERRSFQLFEVRVSKDKLSIEGHAAVFNSLSEDLGGFKETIRPGAFANTIKTDDIRALINHDPNLIIGRNTNGSLKLDEDNSGLHIKNDLLDTTYSRDLLKGLERGDVNQMSFGFATLVDDWRFEGGGLVIRELIEVKLFDVSPVTFPAYAATDVHSMYSPELRSYFENKIKNIVPPDTAERAALRAKHDAMRLRLNEILAT